MRSKIIDCTQRSEQWFELREKRLTVSHSQAIASCGKGLETYIYKKMAKYYSSTEEESYINDDMRRGIDLEDEAGIVYAWENSVEIQKVGFIIWNDYVGCSPDLFVEENGLCEIKCLNDENHLRLLLGGEFETKYTWQAQGQMLTCEKDYCDLISYNPNFKQNLFVKRVTPDEKKFAKLKEGFKIGEKLIKDIEKKMEG